MNQPDHTPPGDHRPFTEPWQAQVFALTIHLHEQGVFTWPEWAEALSAQVSRPDAAADGSDYYQHWTAALQAILADHDITSPDIVDEVTAAWQRAAEATPHGMAIELANDPVVP